MTFRRKQRWLRRIALGLAVASATFATPALAKFDAGAGGARHVTAGGWSGYVDSETGVPVSAGLAGVEDPFLTDIAVRQGESLGGPDGYQPILRAGEAQTFSNVATRPDDRADRFAHADATQPMAASESGRAVEWDDGLAIGIGALALALAIGLGVGYVRRPRLAL